ncbi:MAG: hypothetical protein ABMA64_36605 [Myxococcota bacterium]
MDEADRELLRSLLRRPLLSLAVTVDGAPCAGLAPFLHHGDGLLVHVSGLARHTAGLGDGAPFSAVIHLPDAPDPLAVPRVMLEGHASAAPGEWASRWVAAFPSAAQTVGLADFRFVRLNVERARLVAGFGRAMGLAPRILRELG